MIEGEDKLEALVEVRLCLDIPGRHGVVQCPEAAFECDRRRGRDGHRGMCRGAHGEYKAQQYQDWRHRFYRYHIKHTCASFGIRRAVDEAQSFASPMGCDVRTYVPAAIIIDMRGSDRAPWGKSEQVTGCFMRHRCLISRTADAMLRRRQQPWPHHPQIRQREGRDHVRCIRRQPAESDL